MTRGIFLQVRLASRRLPNKALLNLDGMSLIEWAMRSLGGVFADTHALVTDPGSSKALCPVAERWGWQLFVGDPENVLARYVAASEAYGTDMVLRATGDNPWVSPQTAQANLDGLADGGWDLYALAHSPLGTGTEAIRTEALTLALAGNPDDYEREHVTPFIYRRPQDFRAARPSVVPLRYFPEGRVTVDTLDDLNCLETIQRRALFRKAPEPEEIIPFLRQHG